MAKRALRGACRARGADREGAGGLCNCYGVTHACKQTQEQMTYTDTGTNDLCMFIDQIVDRDCDHGLLHVSFSSADFGNASN